MKRLLFGDKSTDFVTESPQPNRIPLTYDFLRYLYGAEIIDSETTYEDYAELSAMYTVAYNEGRLTKREIKAMQDKLEYMLNSARIKDTLFQHTTVYRELLLKVLECVYTTGTENWQVWETLTSDIDDMANVLLPEEYKYLVGLISWHGVEIENTRHAEINNGQLRANTHAKNYVSKENLASEIREKLVLGIGLVTLVAARRRFIHYKIQQAVLCHIITNDDRKALLDLMNDIAGPLNQEATPKRISQRIKKGDILKSNADIICHAVNCKGTMDSGLSLQVKNRYPFVYQQYSEWCIQRSDTDLLGHVLFVKPFKAETFLIANIFALKDYGIWDHQVDYPSLEKGLLNIKMYAEAHNLSVALPYGMGCGMSGGSWGVISNIIDRVFRDTTIDVTIWTLDGSYSY